MNLENFVALIALDSDRRQAFLANPDDGLSAAGVDSSCINGLVPTLERLAKALSRSDFPPPPNVPTSNG